MLEFKEVKIARILNPTAIDLGEYVINPFMGCEFSCLYCYVRSNRLVSRKKKPWGEYVDVRVNAPELLEKEILSKKPKRVLLGSTTECFQPAERRYRITARILEILNKHKIYYCILTRSPYILDYIALLKQGFCERIYFTVNKFKPEFKQRLEPKSPGLDLREEAVSRLLRAGLPVIPYFSPLIPWVSDIQGVFLKFKEACRVEFECLNYRLNNIAEIINNIYEADPSLKENYERMLNDRIFYAHFFEELEKEIDKQARSAKKRYNIYIHKFEDYFKNTYSRDGS